MNIFLNLITGWFKLTFTGVYYADNKSMKRHISWHDVIVSLTSVTNHKTFSKSLERKEIVLEKLAV